MLDLFSGLGGASQSFLENGWEIDRIENNPALGYVAHTKIQDVRNWMDDLEIPAGYYDLIWASPPCLEFSMAYNAPKSVARRDNIQFEPNMQLMLEAQRIIQAFQPKYWVIENVMGAQEFFNPILGKPTQIINSFCLWGKFPRICMPPNYKHLKHDVGSKNPMRANVRALIPIEVSEQLRRAIEEQTTLEDWL